MASSVTLSSASTGGMVDRTVSREHISALDGIRGVAILMVFLFHYAGGGRSSSTLLRAISVIKEGGWMGVDLFFVLSGFLITGILVDTKDSPDYFRTFYFRRALRIFPIYYAALAFIFLLTPLIGAHWRWGHLAYVFYGANIAGFVDPTLNEPSAWTPLYHIWSLAVEEQFYFVWPFVVWKIARRSSLLWAAVAMAIASAVLRAVAAHSSLGLGYSQLPFRLDGFALGAVVAVAIREGHRALLERIAGGLMAAGGVGLLVVGLCARTLLQWTFPMAAAGVACATLMFAALLLQTLQRGHPTQWIMNRGWLRFFGKYSYGLYLYHVLLLPLFFSLLPQFQRALHSTTMGQMAWFLTSLAANSIIAVGSYHLFEEKFLRLKRHFEYRARDVALAAQSGAV